ncbi:MAG: hypothetical protein JW751_22185, partial [Polyangiaceae bacterium]|nr:hypothetical protein [Polyangiaceae bacterium]
MAPQTLETPASGERAVSGKTVPGATGGARLVGATPVAEPSGIHLARQPFAAVEVDLHAEG